MDEIEKNTPDVSGETKTFSTIREALKDCVPPEILEGSARLVAASTVSNTLATMRIRAGISQKMMAAALGCTQPRISAIESAINNKMSMTSVLKYVEVTGLPFKAQLEDGRVIAVSTVPGSRRPRKHGVSRKAGKASVQENPRKVTA